MPINSFIQHTRDTDAVFVIYSLKNKAEIKNLLSALNKSYDSYEITIFNIKIIPLELLLTLNSIKNKIKTFTVNEKRLLYYLSEIGFNIKFEKHTKSLKTTNHNTIKYIGLGGSAGSLEKFIDIVKTLPPSDNTFFIVMHQKKDIKSSLATILQKYTDNYNVIEAVSDTKILPSTIYIAPPNKQMIVVGEFIFLSDEEQRHFAKPSVSTTFESLANTYKDQFLAILVCGYGSDGSDSLKVIRNNGGKVIIEQPYECRATPMLENAINTKEYDFILSIYNISKYLNELSSKTTKLQDDLDDFLEDIYNQYGYDYRDYNKKHILRRIEYFYNKFMFESFIELKYKVLTNNDYFKEMFLDISVNITTFFRNPDVYKQLQDILYKELKDKQDIKIWCAGCSTGEEPYSLAILLKELGFLDKTLIYATDINEIVLTQAKNGVYNKKSYRIFLEHYEKMGGNHRFLNYFNNYDDFVIVNDEIKKNILFFKHNLATDSSLNEFQLIFCRNVIIYFNKDLTTKVFNLFDMSLEDGGLLVLGESETLNKSNFITLDKISRIYKKEGI